MSPALPATTRSRPDRPACGALARQSHPRRRAGVLAAALTLLSLGACTSTDSGLVDEGDARDRPVPHDGRVEYVSLSALVPLCELLTLELAQQVDPKIVGQDPEATGSPIDYWCNWTMPRTAAPAGENPWGPSLGGVGILDLGDTPDAGPIGVPNPDDDTSFVREPIAGLGDGADYVVRDGRDSPRSVDGNVDVVVRSADGTRETNFRLGAGRVICVPDQAADNCTSGDLEYARDPELRERLVAVAEQLVVVIRARLG